jgi:hypothetical protein
VTRSNQRTVCLWNLVQPHSRLNSEDFEWSVIRNRCELTWTTTWCCLHQSTISFCWQKGWISTWFTDGISSPASTSSCRWRTPLRVHYMSLGWTHRKQWIKDSQVRYANRLRFPFISCFQQILPHFDPVPRPTVGVMDQKEVNIVELEFREGLVEKSVHSSIVLGEYLCGWWLKLMVVPPVSSRVGLVAHLWRYLLASDRSF